MEIPREQILKFLREQGEADHAKNAEGELPETVDTDRDAGLLQKFGVEPSDLMSRLGDIPGL